MRDGICQGLRVEMLVVMSELKTGGKGSISNVPARVDSWVE